MAIPPLIDADISQDKPLKTLTVMHALRDRAAYLQQDAPNGGAGIDANVQSLMLAFGANGHSHNGDDAQGSPIDTPGIAAGAASLSNMFAANSVSTAKIDNVTMGTSELATGSVTVEKMSGRMGYALTGSESWDVLDTPRPAIDEIYRGDTMVLSNPKGAIGVVCGAQQTANGLVDFFVRSVSGSTVRLGLRFATSQLADTGVWDCDARLI